MSQLQEYLNKTFNIDDRTSATIIITLFVFVLGILVNQLLKVISDFLKRKNLRKIFLLNLSELEKRALKQSHEYKSSSEQFSFTYTENFNLQKIDISQLIILKELGYKDTFNAFFSGIENWFKFKNLYRKAFNKIWDAIFAMDFWQGISLEMNHFNTAYSAYNEKRNLALQAFQTLLESKINTENLNHQDSNIAGYYRSLNIIVSDWQRLPKRSRADIIHRNIVLKVRIINRKFEKFNIPIIVDFNSFLLEASLQYQNIRLLYKVYNDRFTSLSILFRKHSRLINKGHLILKKGCC
jgi:hypothetical protein